MLGRQDPGKLSRNMTGRGASEPSCNLMPGLCFPSGLTLASSSKWGGKDELPSCFIPEDFSLFPKEDGVMGFCHGPG
jgi:hypothetical protein